MIFLIHFYLLAIIKMDNFDLVIWNLFGNYWYEKQIKQNKIKNISDIKKEI